MGFVEEIDETNPRTQDTPAPADPETLKHEEIARGLVPVFEACHVLEEILLKHYQSLEDPRVKAIETVNHQLKHLRSMLTKPLKDSSMYYQVSL